MDSNGNSHNNNSDNLAPIEDQIREDSMIMVSHNSSRWIRPDKDFRNNDMRIIPRTMGTIMDTRNLTKDITIRSTISVISRMGGTTINTKIRTSTMISIKISTPSSLKAGTTTMMKDIETMDKRDNRL